MYTFIVITTYYAPGGLAVRRITDLVVFVAVWLLFLFRSNSRSNRGGGGAGGIDRRLTRRVCFGRFNTLVRREVGPSLLFRSHENWKKKSASNLGMAFLSKTFWIGIP